jgi:hypothetical protein
MGYMIQKGSASRELLFLMIDSTDHVSPKAGLGPTVTIRKPGGAFGAPVGAVSEIANGWYKVAGNAGDTDTLGALLLHATAGGADPTDAQFEVVAFDPQATDLGILDLADAIETGLTPRQALRIAMAALAGTMGGAGTGTEKFQSAKTASKDRIVATVDNSGNRTAVAVDGS